LGTNGIAIFEQIASHRRGQSRCHRFSSSEVPFANHPFVATESIEGSPSKERHCGATGRPISAEEVGEMVKIALHVWAQAEAGVAMGQEIITRSISAKRSASCRRGGVDCCRSHDPIGPQRRDPLIRRRPVGVQHQIRHEIERKGPRERPIRTVNRDRSKQGHGDDSGVG
jgi:hypothetical protein